MGVGSDGTLYTPNGKRLLRLPLDLAFWIQKLQRQYLSQCRPKTLKPKERHQQQRLLLEQWKKDHGFVTTSAIGKNTALIAPSSNGGRSPLSRLWTAWKVFWARFSSQE